VFETGATPPPQGPVGDKLVRNSVWLIGATIVVAVLGFAFWFVVARIFTPEQVGIATSLITATTMIGLLSVCGLNTTIIRFRSSSAERHVLVAQSLTTVVTVAGIISTSYILIIPAYEPSLAFLGTNWAYATGFVGGSMLAGFNVLTDAVFIAARRAEYALFINGLLHGAARIALSFTFIGLGAYGIYASTLGAYLICAVTSLFVMSRTKIFRFTFGLRGGINRNLIRYSISDYLAGIFTIAPVMLLPLVALHSLGKADAGYYYLTFQIANMIYAISLSVGESLLSEGAAAQSQLPSLLRRSGALLSALVVPAIVVLWLAGGLLLSLFGTDYAEHGAELLSVLALAALPVTIYTWASFLLKLTRQMRSLIISSLAFASVTLGFAVAWADRGIVWLGWAWLAGNLVGAVVGVTLLFAGYRRKRPSRTETWSH
jgi:O-antigen/teichoic acid export membrane protein